MNHLIKLTLIISFISLALISLSSFANPLQEATQQEATLMSEEIADTAIESSVDLEQEISQGYDRLCIEAQSTPYTCAQWKCIKPCIPDGETCILMGIDICKRKVSACEKRCGVN